MLLGGKESTVKNLLDSTLYVRFGDVTLSHLYQTIRITRQRHREITLQLHNSLRVVSFELITKLIHKLQDISFPIITQIQNHSRLARLDVRIRVCDLVINLIYLRRRCPPTGGASRKVTQGLRLEFTSIRWYFGGSTVFFRRRELHLGGVLTPWIHAIIREVRRLPPLMQCISPIHLLNQLLLRFILQVILARIIFTNQF